MSQPQVPQVQVRFRNSGPVAVPQPVTAVLSVPSVTISLVGVYSALIFFLIGVMKSSMGELTNPTNRAEAFALMPVIWAFGASMG